MSDSVFASNYSATVLIADDDEEILMVLEVALKKEGYKVLLAKNGNEAVDHLANHRVDIILSDVDMPVMNGYQLVKQVKESAKTRLIPFLFFSGYDQPNDRIKGLEFGATDYITKPFEPREVCLRVRNVLHEKQQLEERQNAVMVSTLNLIQLGIVVLRENGGVLVHNTKADEILQSKDGLSLKRGRLCGRTVKETLRIDEMISQAQTLVKTFNPERINPIRIERPSMLRDYALIALPLDIEMGGYHGERVITLIIHDPETTHIPSEKVLIGTYQFTKAEARVASLLIQGKSINEICEFLDVKRNTVCTHLKKLYMKTDTQRQSDFTRLLLSGLSQLKL